MLDAERWRTVVQALKCAVIVPLVSIAWMLGCGEIPHPINTEDEDKGSGKGSVTECGFSFKRESQMPKVDAELSRLRGIWHVLQDSTPIMTNFPEGKNFYSRDGFSLDQAPFQFKLVQLYFKELTSPLPDFIVVKGGSFNKAYLSTPISAEDTPDERYHGSRIFEVHQMGQNKEEASSCLTFAYKWSPSKTQNQIQELLWFQGSVTVAEEGTKKAPIKRFLVPEREAMVYKRLKRESKISPTKDPYMSF